jgi:organic hydroperoxide reductase OsmC/OhrA
MSIFKDYTFTVAAIGRRPGVVRLVAPDKPALEVATPVEFRDGMPGYWTPEDMLVAATASCFVLTFTSLAKRRDVAFEELEVTGSGHVTRRADRRFGFVVVELRASVKTDAANEQPVREIAREAHGACIVGRALDVPVELELDVRVASPVPVT